MATSGMKPSSELLALFKEFVQDESQLAFLVTIETVEGSRTKQYLAHHATIPRSASVDFFADLEKLQPYVKSDKCLYVILQREPGTPEPLVGVMYSPDDAPAREKMPYSTTCSTLYRELGDQHFKKKLEIKHVSGLTPSGFEELENYEKAAPPLSDKEQTLSAVKEAEAAARSGTGGRAVVTSRSKLDIGGDGIIEALEKFGRGEISFLKLKFINDDTKPQPKQILVLAEPDSTVPTSLDSAVAAIPTDDSTYTFYRWQGGGGDYFVLFLYTFPKHPTTFPERKRQLAYTYSRNNMQEEAELRFGFKVDAYIEEEHPSNIDEARVVEALKAKGEDPNTKKKKKADTEAGAGGQSEQGADTDAPAFEPSPITGLSRQAGANLKLRVRKGYNNRGAAAPATTSTS